MKNNFTFTDAWKAPFWYDDWCYIFDKDNTMVFTFEDNVCVKKVNDELVWDNSFCYNFTNLLNDKDGEKLSNLEIKDGCDLYMDGKYIGCFRGWGHLTSPGGLDLSYDDAAKLQDEFIEWCLNKLRK